MIKVGDKVVCIDDKNQLYGGLVEGEIYEVVAVKERTGGLMLIGFGNIWHKGYRFRKVDTDWVDELLCKLIEEVEADELVSV